MTDSINVPATTPSSVEVSFAWTPSGTYTFTAPNGIVLTAPNASAGVPLIFTATTTIDNQGVDISGPLTIIEYRWDFGDGLIGYGNPVTHTYQLANFNAQTVLRVTDSQGRRWYDRAQMYLYPLMAGSLTFKGALTTVKSGP